MNVLCFTLFFLLSVWSSSAVTIPSNFTSMWYDRVGTLMTDTNILYMVASRNLAASMQAMWDVVAVEKGWTSFVCHPTQSSFAFCPTPPGSCNKRENVKLAAIYAAYRSLLELFNSTAATTNLNNFMNSAFGISSPSSSTNPLTPEGIGNIIGHNVFLDKMNDGFNQLGNTSGSTGPYSDYSDHRWVNPPMLGSPNVGNVGNCSLLQVNHFQPIVTASGVQPVTFMHIGAARPTSRPVPFPVEAPNKRFTNTDAAYQADYNHMRSIYSNLNDTTKALAHYFASGNVKGFNSNWRFLVYNQLAIDVIANENLDDLQSLKLLTAAATAQVDGDIQNLRNKLYYDVARPPLGMQCLFDGQTITSWKGPYQGCGSINGHDWKAFHPFVNNNGPEYPCQHCTQGGVAAQTFRNFFGNEQYRGKNYTIAQGIFQVEPKITVGNPGYIAGVTDVPNTGPFSIGYAPATDIDLKWGTWTQYAEDMAFSRICYGVHTWKSHIVGRRLGEDVANMVWRKLSNMLMGQSKCRNIGDDWEG